MKLKCSNILSFGYQVTYLYSILVSTLIILTQKLACDLWQGEISSLTVGDSYKSAGITKASSGKRLIWNSITHTHTHKSFILVVQDFTLIFFWALQIFGSSLKALSETVNVEQLEIMNQNWDDFVA